jgi:hypothetical protein
MSAGERTWPLRLRPFSNRPRPVWSLHEHQLSSMNAGPGVLTRNFNTRQLAPGRFQPQYVHTPTSLEQTPGAVV